MVSLNISAESVILIVKWQDAKNTYDFFVAADAKGDIINNIET
jgi:hypothetical protein